MVLEKEQEAQGIIAPRPLREAAQRPLVEHLRDFKADLKARGRSPMYVYNVTHSAAILMEACSWRLPRDVTPESFTAWRARQRDKAAKTLNEYLNSLCALLNWMHAQGRLLANPLACVGRVDTAGKQVRRRRALTDDEKARLLAAAGARKPVYLAALLTGLRRSELEALQWGDVHLDAPRPFLNVRASTTKNGKAAIQFLRDDLAAELRTLKPAGACEGLPVFADGVPSMPDFRADLAAAGIPETDGQGRRVDFHALRHTLCTDLQRSGVQPTVAMQVMRHSDLRLTSVVYTDATCLPTADAIDRLPRFDRQEPAEAVATGTDGTAAGGWTENHHKTGVFSGHRLSQSATLGTDMSAPNRSVKPGDCPAESASVTVGREMRHLGLEPAAFPAPRPEERGGGQKITTSEGDRQLQQVAQAWPQLPEAVRAAIVAIVANATPEKEA
jgi:integrase